MIKRTVYIGLGALTLLFALALLTLRVEPSGPAPHHALPQARLQLAKVTPAARRDVNYSLLDSRLRLLMAKPAMVGLAVGVIENGHITFLNGYGETLAGSGDPVTPQTVFRWASVSKGLAATMVAKLAEQGKINLNAPVSTYSATLKLPGGEENSATVSDLLSHRLGLYRNAYDNKLEEGQDPRFLRQTLAQLNSVCAPGTCWTYQNVAFDAASEMVSKVTGLPYEQAVRQYLFNPIGMTSGSVSLQGLESNQSWAKPHSAGRKPLPIVDTYYRVPAAGGINSNIKDMALWMIAQAGGMPDVLDQRLLDIIHAPLVVTPTERGRLRKFLERLGTAWSGYGWRSYDYAGHRIIGHRGGINGYRSLILFDPQLKSGVVALWNSNTAQPGGVEFEVMDMLYHLPFRDWLELNSAPGASAIVESDDADASPAGNDNGPGAALPTASRHQR